MAADFFDQVRAFYDEHRQGLFTYALSLTHDHESAEDAVQSAFFGLLRRDRPPKDLRPFVFRSVRNAAVDGHRSHRPGVSLDAEKSREVTVDGHPVRDHALQQCLLKLGNSERECIVLKIFGGLTFAEIAVVGGSPLNTVASRYRRGLEKMRTMLDGET